MDEALTRKLVRQLRWLNVVVTLFGIIIIAALIVGGVLIYHVANDIHKAQMSISKLQQNPTQQLCNSQAANLLKTYTNAC